jgi:hypothetical protein
MGIIYSADRGKLIIEILCYKAECLFFPPFPIFVGKDMQQWLLNGAPA